MGQEAYSAQQGKKWNKGFHKFLQQRDVWFLALFSLWKWVAASERQRCLLVTEGAEETIKYLWQRQRPWMSSLTPRHLKKRANIAFIVLSLTVNDKMTSFTKLVYWSASALTNLNAVNGWGIGFVCLTVIKWCSHWLNKEMTQWGLTLVRFFLFWESYNHFYY